MAGFGRTVSWFACDHWNVVPDIITVAKGITSSYLPLGAMIARGEIVYPWRQSVLPRRARRTPGIPLACASAVRLDRGVQGGGGRRERRRGRRVPRRLAARASPRRHPSIGDVRGLGLLLGRRARQEPRDAGRCSSRTTPRGRPRCRSPGSAKAALEQGLYLMTHWNMLMIVPPLTITRDEVDDGRRDPRRRPRDSGRARRVGARQRRRKSETATAVSSRASHRTVCPPGTMTTSSSAPSASRCASRRWSYGR